MTAPVAVPVGVLQDAELVVLGASGRVPVMPAWTALLPNGRLAARRAARAALVSRALLDPRGDGVSALRRDVRSVLVLRARATEVVAVARVSPAGRDHWYAHRVGGVVLLEQVGPEGVHRFALATTGELPALLVAAALHPAATGPGTGSPEDAEDWVRADVALEAAGEAVYLSVVSTPGGAWVLGDGCAEGMSGAAAGRLLTDALDGVRRGAGRP